MTIEQIRISYGARAAEYTDLCGSVEVMADEDRRVIAEWATTHRGPVLDAGSGPGHWTAFLHDHGIDASGIDVVPEFVAGARSRFPRLEFRLGEMSALAADDGSLSGILSWYSIIHTPPADVPAILKEFRRVLRPGGTLLLGFFEGAGVEPFDHAVTTAWRWPIETMASEVAAVGFDVIEHHARIDEGHRPHGAILARRQE